MQLYLKYNENYNTQLIKFFICNIKYNITITKNWQIGTYYNNHAIYCDFWSFLKTNKLLRVLKILFYASINTLVNKTTQLFWLASRN